MTDNSNIAGDITLCLNFKDWIYRWYHLQHSCYVVVPTLRIRKKKFRGGIFETGSSFLEVPLGLLVKE